MYFFGLTVGLEVQQNRQEGKIATMGAIFYDASSSQFIHGHVFELSEDFFKGNGSAIHKGMFSFCLLL